MDQSNTDWNGLANIPVGFADGIDNDTSDWNMLANIPTDIADGDQVLSNAEVDAYVVDGALDLAAGTTLMGTPF